MRIPLTDPRAAEIKAQQDSHIEKVMGGFVECGAPPRRGSSISRLVVPTGWIELPDERPK